MSKRSLRRWQAMTLPTVMRLFDSGQQTVSLAACPASGKTRFSAAVAAELGYRIVMVVPTDALVRQAIESFARDGLVLVDARALDGSREPSDTNGMVTTYATVSRNSLVYRSHARTKTFVILDEGHHAGDEKAWGDSIKEAFEVADKIMVTTGTPWRSDEKAIPFVSYSTDGSVNIDVTYTFGDAWAEVSDQDRPIRFISFEPIDATSDWQINGVSHSARISEFASRDEKDFAVALNAALDPYGEWIRVALTRANTDLQERRKDRNAAGLVICKTIAHAEQVARVLRSITKGEVVVVHGETDAKAAQDIANFRTSQAPWIVAVSMVSEGVDIPRLEVCVLATNKLTPLAIHQAVGRIIRRSSTNDHAAAAFYFPQLAPIMAVIRELEQMLASAVVERDKKVESGGERQPGPDVTILGSRDVESGDIMLPGGQTVPLSAVELLREVLPPNVADQAAMIAAHIIGVGGDIKAPEKPQGNEVDPDEWKRLQQELDFQEKATVKRLIGVPYNQARFATTKARLSSSVNAQFGAKKARSAWTRDQYFRAIQYVRLVQRDADA